MLNPQGHVDMYFRFTYALSSSVVGSMRSSQMTIIKGKKVQKGVTYMCRDILSFKELCMGNHSLMR